MYLKRILLTVVILGLLIGGLFSAMVYRTLFISNTGFNNEQAYVFIPVQGFAIIEIHSGG